MHNGVYKNPDEALRNSRQNARAMRRDAFIMSCLRSRMMPTAQAAWSLEPEDANDPEQQKAVDVIGSIIDEIPDWLKFKMVLLEAIWFGRYAINVNYQWDFRKGKRMIVKDWLPLHGDKLIFSWKYPDTIGYLINAAKAIDPTMPTEFGRANYLTPCERESVVIHKHEIEDGDFEEPEVNGSIHGIGLRSRIYWYWWHKQELLAWLTEFLERFGMGGFLIYTFEAGNPESKSQMEELAQKQTGNNILLFPRAPGTENNTTGLEIIEPKGTGIEQFLKIIDDLFSLPMKLLICGQTLSSETASTGLGSGVAAAHENTFGRIVKYDAENLENTITRELVDVLMRHNFPGVNFKLKFKLAVESPDPKSLIEAAQILHEMGAEINVDELRNLVGLSRPDSQDETLEPQNNTGGNGSDLALEQELADEQIDNIEEEDAQEAQEALAASGLRGSVGGFQTAVEIIRKVANGEIPKTSGIESLVLFMGIPRESAENLLKDVVPPTKEEKDDTTDQM